MTKSWLRPRFTVCYHLSTGGVAAVVGPQLSPTTSRHVQSLCESMQIPHLEARWSYPVPSSWDKEQFTANFYPSPIELSEVSSTLEYYRNQGGEPPD